MNLDKYPDLLTLKHLMEIFDVSRSTVFKEVKSGKFGPITGIGNTIKIPKAYVIKKFFADYQ